MLQAIFNGASHSSAVEWPTATLDVGGVLDYSAYLMSANMKEAGGGKGEEEEVGGGGGRWPNEEFEELTSFRLFNHLV